MSAEVGFRSAVADSRYNIERLPVAALYERRGWLPFGSRRQPLQRTRLPVAALYERRGWLPFGGHRQPLQASFTKLQIANFA